jgi:hypothetical protein
LIIVTQNSMPRIHHRTWRWTGGSPGIVAAD